MRITNQMMQNNLVETLNRQQYELNKVESNLSTGTKIHLPSDNPIGAATQMLLRGRTSELKQYERNVGEASDRLNLIDGKLSQVNEIMIRVRTLTVQAANGTNSNFELKEAIAKEVNQHLLALVEVGNSKDATGRNLFGGSIIEKEAFKSVFANMQSEGTAIDSSLISVEYQGDILSQIREIERGEQIDVTIPGNRVFWGTNMQITSNKNASTYTIAENQSFKIDGTEIKVEAGDGLDDIISKINSSGIEVSASKGGNDDLILIGKTPHQIWLEDIGGGTVLQDMGLIDGSKSEPPNNYSEGAVVSGKSLFDVLITLRDDLVRGDIDLIGGRDLESLDITIENTLRYRTEVGARVNRVEQHEKRIAWDQTYVENLLSKNESIDIAEEITQLKWMETVHSYALKVGAGIIKPTLMDYLR